MKIILKNIDRRAALLAGFEPENTTVLIAAPADFGDAWPDVVASFDLRPDGSAICLARDIAAPTVEGVIAAVAADKARAETGWADIVAEIEEAIARCVAAEPVAVERHVYDPDNHKPLGTLATLQPPSLRLPSEYDGRVTPERRKDPIWTRLNAAHHALISRIEATNKATIEAALPWLRKEKAERDAAEQKAAEKEAADKKAALVKLGAERLATGYWERETAAYNARRDGKPWCAHVTLNPAIGKLVYAWGEWIGRPGEEGVMRLACTPGTVIAWGQKDMRRPDKSVHVIQRMREDGLMENLTTVDAVKALRAAQKVEG